MDYHSYQDKSGEAYTAGLIVEFVDQGKDNETGLFYEYRAFVKITKNDECICTLSSGPALQNTIWDDVPIREMEISDEDPAKAMAALRQNMIDLEAEDEKLEMAILDSTKVPVAVAKVEEEAEQQPQKSKKAKNNITKEELDPVKNKPLCPPAQRRER